MCFQMSYGLLIKVWIVKSNSLENSRQNVHKNIKRLFRLSAKPLKHF